MGRWHRMPPRPGRLCRRPHPQLSGRHPISPFTVHTPEPGDYGDGDPSTVGADDDDAHDFLCVDCTTYGECLDHEDERDAEAAHDRLNDDGGPPAPPYSPHDNHTP